MDEMFMRRALRLAKMGWGSVSPNPMVGAVIVKSGRVIAEGYHRRAGEAHAEVRALFEAGKKAHGATLYINLEPCIHYGRTPPCVEKIIKSGIKRVVVAMRDPNPIVSGRGIRKLRRAGVKTEVGLLGEEATRLNEIFMKYITTGKPFVMVKCAMSLDGKISTVEGFSKWITGEKARRFVHKLRSGVDGILVGSTTVLKDDPLLNVRYAKCFRQPVKIILDTKCRIPLSAKVLSGEPQNTIVATTCSTEKGRKLEEKGVRVLRVKQRARRVDFSCLIRRLGRMGLSSILIEGGGEVIASSIFSGVVDKLLFFLAPKIIGGRDAPTPVEGEGIKKLIDALPVKSMRLRRIGEDILVEGYL